MCHMYNQTEYRNRRKATNKLLSDMDQYGSYETSQEQLIPDDEESSLLVRQENFTDERPPEWKRTANIICAIALSMASFATLIGIFVIEWKKRR